MRSALLARELRPAARQQAWVEALAAVGSEMRVEELTDEGWQ